MHKLAEPAPLRALGTVYLVYLYAFERVREAVAVVRIVPRQREREVVAKSEIAQLLLIYRVLRECSLKLLAALEYLENEIEIVAAVALVEILCAFDRGSVDASKSAPRVSVEYERHKPVALGCSFGKVFLHTLLWFYVHFCCPFVL